MSKMSRPAWPRWVSSTPPAQQWPSHRLEQNRLRRLDEEEREEGERRDFEVRRGAADRRPLHLVLGTPAQAEGLGNRGCARVARVLAQSCACAREPRRAPADWPFPEQRFQNSSRNSGDFVKVVVQSWVS